LTKDLSHHLNIALFPNFLKRPYSLIKVLARHTRWVHNYHDLKPLTK